MLPGGCRHTPIPDHTIPQDMGKKRHTKEARIRAMHEHESGRSQAEICQWLNIAAPTFCR